MSKFILALDSSQIQEYLTCPLKWYYRYKENLELKQYGVSRAAPDKGTLIHSLLDWYYNFRLQGQSVDSAMNAAISVFKQRQETLQLFPQDTKRELETFLVSRFIQYCVRYAINDFEVLPEGVELGFSKKLHEDDEVLFLVEGRIDLINLLQNGYEKVKTFTDHKTQERKSDLYRYKPQFKTYAWATGYDYGMINYFGMQKEYEEGKTFRRDLIYFPKQMIVEWEQTLVHTFYEIYYLLKSKDMVAIPVDTYDERIFYTKRNEASCSGAFDSNPCQFTSLCEEHNWDMKHRIKEFKYNVKEPWTPWKLQKV